MSNPIHELKLINQGTYGCIFHPGINCKGKKENVNYLTKIQKNAKTIENEVKMSAIIRKIKGYTRFFAPILKQCPVKISKQFTNEVKQCDLFKNVETLNLQKMTYVSNKIRYVGNTNLSKHILQQSNVYSLWKETLECHSYLLKAVQKLLSKQIVHFDVKYNNIMFDETISKPIFIDFGISIHIPSLTPQNMRDAFYVFDTYPYWCFDVCVCNYISRELEVERAKTTIFTTKDLEHVFQVFVYSSDNKSSIQNSVFSNSIFHENNAQNIIEKYKSDLFKYYSNLFEGKTWFDVYSHFIETQIYSTWDSYALAVVFLFILDDMHIQKTELFTQFSQTTIYTKYIELLVSILFATPDKRQSVPQTITHLKSIIHEFANTI